MAKSRWFRVAVEGATTDARTIKRAWLVEMAATYKPETYQARVNIEHIRGVTADAPFQALGDVLALKTKDVTLSIGGKDQTLLALFAQIDALEPLVAMNKRGQKLFSSIEINPDFAKSGKAYLTGLAVTDSPASLGTEMLKFCATQGDKSPLAARKHDAGNLFTAAEETVLVIDAEPVEDAETKTLMSSLTALVQKMTGHAPKTDPVTPPVVVPPKPANDDASFADFGTVLTDIGSVLTKLGAKVDTIDTRLTGDLAALKTSIETTPQSTVARPVSASTAKYNFDDAI